MDLINNLMSEKYNISIKNSPYESENKCALINSKKKSYYINIYEPENKIKNLKNTFTHLGYNNIINELDDIFDNLKRDNCANVISISRNK